MKDRIKDYFSFNKKEQRGLIVLLGLMLLSLSVNIFLPVLLPDKEFDSRPFQKKVEEFLANAAKADSAEDKKPHKFSENDSQEKDLLSSFISAPFYFDPNELSEQQWENMEMNPRIIKNILRYREKGGTFRDKEDFRKIYGMDDSLFAILSPYIQIKKKEKYPEESFTSKEKESNWPVSINPKYKPDTVMIELNSADSASLLALSGIGPSFAGRIIKYRERLGGYVKTAQLLEVIGMDSIRFQQFSGQVTVDPQLVRKIDLNSVTFKELLRHPYFEYYMVKAVFNYKDELKRYDSVGQIRKIPVMYDELFEKISPYLEVKH